MRSGEPEHEVPEGNEIRHIDDRSCIQGGMDPGYEPVAFYREGTSVTVPLRITPLIQTGTITGLIRVS
jgi:hypothetical protein